MIFIKFRSTFLSKFVWTTMQIMLIFIVYNFCERDSHILFVNWIKFQLSRRVHKTFNKPSMGHWTGQIKTGKGSAKKVEENREKLLTFRTRLLCVCVEKEPFQKFNGKVRVQGGSEGEYYTKGKSQTRLFNGAKLKLFWLRSLKVFDRSPKTLRG